MNISLRQLKLFEATARLGRLTAAADEQAISQSAASQALKELESTLDYPLFQRVGRELVLTEAGRDALPRVGQILQLVESLRVPGCGSVGGPLRVAASVTIASYLMPRLLADFCELHPGVVPDLKIANTFKVIEALEKGRAHLGLIEGPALHRHLQIIPWREDRLEVFCHPQHPLALSGRLSIEQIRQQRWILREEGSGTRAIFDAAVQKVRAQVRVTFALNRQEAIKQSVKAGLGVGCLSQLSIAEEVAAGELVILRTPLELSRRFSLVAQPLDRNNVLIQALIDFLGLQWPETN
ncbi:LysR family transcriptional regulator [Marinobacterium arenosum]|uniref:LysR family transcriptional regulator n=1 Tax=Marinobacterium arenosum TaxID=2862496 RepID=UPI001C93ADB4|nr:LysR family transcriptional regulator [Marinobacterium arenosum]MBY4677288.1 LysR family transcriptional regulator [Marinobacterium arenosum]